jgi:hypothetical protein
VKYRGHMAAEAVISKPSFAIIVDDETMTWESDPQAKDIEDSMTTYFTSVGEPGTGREFTVLPGGRVT